MNVGTISLVGISVVFFTFLVLFFLFKLLARLFGEQKSTEVKKTDLFKKTNKRNVQTENQQTNYELVAAITAAIESYTSKKIRIMNIREKPVHKRIYWNSQKTKIWRPIRKGVKRGW